MHTGYVVQTPGAYRPQVASWDISEKALEVAGRNAAANGAVVTFCCQDVLSESLSETEVDVLVSNPPYIAEKEKASMERNVLDWEPGLALFVPDDDPLLFYRKIAEAGLRILSPKGRLYYEINRATGRKRWNCWSVWGIRKWSYVKICREMTGW